MVLFTKKRFFMRLIFISVCFFFPKHTFSQVEEIENFIVLQELDSARLLLPKIESHKKPMFERLINRTYTNEDVIEFIGTIQSDNKRQFRLIQSFVERNMIPPKKNGKIDLKYVRLMWYYTNLVRNEYSLQDASLIHQKSSDYVKRVGDKNSIEAKKASIYLNTHPFILKIIQDDLDAAEKIISNDLKLAIELKDTFLILTTRYYKSDLLTAQRRLEDFIRFQRETIELESRFKSKSDYYSLTIKTMVEALLFSGDFDSDEIEGYLLTLFENPETFVQCLPIYAKYVGSIPLHSEATLRVFNLFEVNSLSEFADKLIEIGLAKENKNELIQLFNGVAYMLKKQGFNEKAFAVLEMENELTREIYSKDLAQSIANFEKIKLQEEKEEAVKQEKMIQKYYLILTIVIFVSLIISILLLVRNYKFSKKLAVQNNEKEVLLREIHHRVKNNFQTISSLLDFQMKDIEDEKAVSRIREGQSRLKSMSLIHEKLYQNQDDVATVNLKEYTEQLTEQVLGIYGKEYVKVELKIGKIELDIDTAIPLGLIMNEILTNSCKYAFNQENSDLKIVAELINQGHYQLTIQDNGPGLPESLQVTKLRSLGMKLISRLSKQLHGDVQFLNHSGALIKVRFKDTFERKLVN
jgi:two-component sensor histidine kinase